jgi:hypothetical protein
MEVFRYGRAAILNDRRGGHAARGSGGVALKWRWQSSQGRGDGRPSLKSDGNHFLLKSASSFRKK